MATTASSQPSPQQIRLLWYLALFLSIASFIGSARSAPSLVDPGAKSVNTADMLMSSHPGGAARQLTSSPPQVYKIVSCGSITTIAARHDESYGPGGSWGLLLQQAAAANGVVGRRLSSTSYPQTPSALFLRFTTPSAYYEIICGDSNNKCKKLSVKFDKGLGAAIKGKVKATKHYEGVTSDVTAKFDVKIKCEPKQRYKFQGEDSYITDQNVAIAVSNVNKQGDKCSIGKDNWEGSIWIDGHELVSTCIKTAENYFAKTKQVEAETLTVSIF